MKGQLAGLLLGMLMIHTACGASTVTEGAAEGAAVASLSEALIGVDPETALCSAGAYEVQIGFIGSSGSGPGDRVRVDPMGMLCLSSGGSVCKFATCTNQTITLTPTPQPGYFFLGWGGDCASFGSATTCTLKVTADSNILAAFAPLRACTPGAARSCQYCAGHDPLETDPAYAGTERCFSDGSGWGSCTPLRRVLGPYYASDPMFSHSCGFAVGKSSWRVPAGTGGSLPCGAQLGPSKSLPPGRYELRFAGWAYGNANVSIDVRDVNTGTVIGSSSIITLRRGNYMQSIPFWSYSDCHQLEFRLLWHGGDTIDHDSTMIVPIS